MSSKNRVCHLTCVHTTDDTRIFHKECTSLANAGYDVYLVGKGESREENGVHVVGIGNPLNIRIVRAFIAASKVVNTGLELDADIYHLHDPILILFAGKLLRHGKKVIYDSHERWTEQLLCNSYPMWLKKILSNAYGKKEKKVAAKIDGLIFPCLKDGKHPFEGMCKRVENIDNYSLLEDFYEKYDEAAEKWERSICYVGGLSYNRGITHLIQSAASADCTVHLAGPFNTPAYEQALREMPEFTHVDYLGILKHSDVAENILHCQIGMATILNKGQYNKYDNMPTKAYEYMALGLPVILTTAPYNNKMIEKYHFGICVNPENTDEVAQAIKYLFDHPEEAKQMGMNGREAVKMEFNWGVEEKKLIALYKDILE